MIAPNIRALSLAAALALSSAATALAEPHGAAAGSGPQAAGAAFDARMEAFRAEADAINAEPGLDACQKTARIAALWSGHQPEVAAFAAAAGRQAADIATTAFSEVDVAAIVQQAMTAVEPMVRGLTANGVLTHLDPDHMVTQGLVAQYGMDLALDGLETPEATPPAASERATPSSSPSPA